MKKKLFICQPLYNLSPEDIYAVRMSIWDTMCKDEWDLIYNYKYQDMDYDDWQYRGYLWHIGRQIQDLQGVDLVVFAPGWREARECLAVFDICNLYDVKCIDFADEYL